MRNDKVYILRESVVKITQMLSGKGIRVTQQGIDAYVKADRNGVPVLVNLPYLPDNATEELCQAIQGFLDHEVAHILFTDFPLMGKAHAEGGKQLGFLLNALEDPRIEKEMAKRFQGSAYNLGVTGQFYLDKFVVPRLEERAKAGDAKGVITTLMVPMLRAMSGQRVFQEFMKDKWAAVESVYSRIEDLAAQVEGAKSTADCFEVAKEIAKRLRDGAPAKSEEKDDEGKGGGKGGKSSSSKGKSGKSKPSENTEPAAEGEDIGDTDEESTESKGKDGKSKDDEKDKSEDESEDKSEDEGEADDEEDAEGDADADEDEEEGDVGDADEGEEDGVIKEGKSMGDTDGDEPDDDEKSDLDGEHPIWDELDKDGANGFDESMSRAISDTSLKSAKNADYLPFTKDYDLIEKLPIGRGYDPTMTQRLCDKVDHMVAPLQKDLERAIAARSLAIRSHGHRSGRLHAANLSRLAVGDDRVFSRKHENHSKDVAVELVVDASGSMSGSKIHTAAQAAYALSSVLERLNIKNEVICFTTKGIHGAETEMYKQQAEKGIRFSRAEGLYMPILKGYEDRMSTTVRERFGWLPNTNILRNNVDGECVEIAARRLMARKEAGKIMIVLSDGYPAAAGSRGDLQAHLKRVVKDVSASGVNVVGIGIQSDAVNQFYPKSLVLNRVEDLPGAVIKELRRLLLA